MGRRSKSSPRNSSNLAAEFYVASLLYRLGYTATITLGHTKEIDIVVYDEKTKRTVTIDVKGLKNTTNWVMPDESKLSPRKTHFFALVTFRNKIRDLSAVPEVFFVPSTRVKELWSPWSGKPEIKCIEYKNVSKHAEFKDLSGIRQFFPHRS